MSETYGLLIDYEYCTGCQSCVVSCKEEHNYPVGKWGIRVYEDGPWNIEGDMYNFNYIPFPTDLCDLCADRTAKGREPICVHHCLANCMVYGPVKELAERMASKPKQVLWVPQYKPLEAKGKFVSKNEKRRSAAAIEVKAVKEFRTAAHRIDNRMELVDIKTKDDE
jgi:Fe-S-cluster-containing dehydrogenase component